MSNSVVHLELHTGDLRGAVDFYAHLFGWRSERIHAGGGSYLALAMGDRVGGGGEVKLGVFGPKRPVHVYDSRNRVEHPAHFLRRSTAR